MIPKVQPVQPIFYQHPKHMMPLESKKKQVVSEGEKSFAEVLKEAKEKKYGAS
jgi:hypothetical protein